MPEHNTPLNERFWSRISTSSLSKNISIPSNASENFNSKIFLLNTMFLQEVLASAKHTFKKNSESYVPGIFPNCHHDRTWLALSPSLLPAKGQRATHGSKDKVCAPQEGAYPPT